VCTRQLHSGSEIIVHALGINLASDIICCARSNATRGGEQVLALRLTLCQVDPDCRRRASPSIQSVRSQRRRAHFPLSAAMFVFPQMMSLLVSLASAKLLAPISTLGEFVFFNLQSVLNLSILEPRFRTRPLKL
jgi:hypothetical protein